MSVTPAWRRKYYADNLKKLRAQQRARHWADRPRAKRHAKKQRKIRGINYRLFMSGLACNYCWIKDTRLLEWAHIGDQKKKCCVTQYIYTSAKKLVEEMNKCVVLCANHHKIFDLCKEG